MLGPGPAGVLQLQQLVQRIINLSTSLAFIAVTVVLVYAGVRFIVSGGEPKSIQGAGAAMTWAILGILFLVLAWLILRLVEAFTGVPVTQFCIGLPAGPGNPANPAACL